MSNTQECLRTLLPLTDLDPIRTEMLTHIPQEDAQALVRYLYRECRSSPVAREVLPSLFAAVERSDKTISAWIREILDVFVWLEENHSTGRFLDILEYVSCAQEGSSGLQGHSIRWYLDNYGFHKKIAR